jgi:hypothetical protein
MTNLMTKIGRAIPLTLLNEFLLRAPFLYRMSLLNYETQIDTNGGIEDLLSQLRQTFGVPGDVIECGCARGGASALMGRELIAHKIHKKVFAFDSFVGFQPAELRREREAGLTTAPDSAFTSTSLEYVSRKVKALSLESVIIPVKGFFQTTLPSMKAPVSYALLDCDLKESLTYCAEMLWPRLSPTGRMLIDDYQSTKFRGARLAVDLFVDMHKGEISEHGLLNRLYLVVKK